MLCSQDAHAVTRAGVNPWAHPRIVSFHGVARALPNRNGLGRTGPAWSQWGAHLSRRHDATAPAPRSIYWGVIEELSTSAHAPDASYTRRPLSIGNRCWVPNLVGASIGPLVHEQVTLMLRYA